MFNIKILQKEDIKNRTNSILATLSRFSKDNNLSTAELTAIFDKIQKQGTKIFVAYDNENGVIGMTTLLLEQKILRNGAVAGHIEDVCVRSGFEGKGIGSKLVSLAIIEAKKNNCYKLILDCDKGLVPFYEKLGLKDDGVFMKMYLN